MITVFELPDKNGHVSPDAARECKQTREQKFSSLYEPASVQVHLCRPESQRYPLI